MTSILALARPDLLGLEPPPPAIPDRSLARLHANEFPWRPPGDDSPCGLNRYPDPQPPALLERLADLYQVEASRVLASRGGDEAIDLLIRGFCRSWIDGVLVLRPTFGGYRTAARIHAAPVVELPLSRESGFRLDVGALLECCRRDIKIVFLCSPNNPTGTRLDSASIQDVARELEGRALVAVDEAYVEFASGPSVAPLVSRFSNLVVLRTLSKAYALAGARCGALIGDPELVSYLGRVIHPYALPSPVILAVLRALAPHRVRAARERVRALISERERLRAALEGLPLARRVWPSEANFLLVECRDAARFARAGLSGGVLVRLFPEERGLQDCARVTVGTSEENDRLLRALAGC
jgi:histidinol-phosphate aminotransferase